MEIITSPLPIAIGISLFPLIVGIITFIVILSKDQ